MSNSNVYPLPPSPMPSSSPAIVPLYPTPSRPADPYTQLTAHSAIPFAPIVDMRSTSPTPSEKEELKKLDGTLQRAFRKESWKDREFVVSFIVLAVIIIIVVVIAVFKDQIILALTPAAEWVREQPAGFLIPIAFLIVLSVPPLVGAEVIQLLCGFIYGLGVGFSIVCAGTIIGESITYLACRYCFRSRAEKVESGNKGSIRWPSLARVIREGGFLVAVVVRYTVIPTHITTALFSVCGINYWVFLASLILALPRQIIGVYVGVLAAESANGTASDSSKKISTAVIGVLVVITIFAMRWITKRQKAAGLAMLRARRGETDTLADATGLLDSAYPLPNIQNKSMDPISQIPVPQHPLARTQV
ncbi:Golgi apparatus membrane protein TVP38 [Ceratobasidium sp. AG-Ba]|nr:Golgi apparatus membrane protein TVP38 [Ceratobasidium sp. AG-Ba]QRW10755.1 Golgi apparatus membrane protein TVP38 [Ceratobasidium sp. AG-Ba]